MKLGSVTDVWLQRQAVSTLSEQKQHLLFTPPDGPLWPEVDVSDLTRLLLWVNKTKTNQTLAFWFVFISANNKLKVFTFVSVFGNVFAAATSSDGWTHLIPDVKRK